MKHDARARLAMAHAEYDHASSPLAKAATETERAIRDWNDIPTSSTSSAIASLIRAVEHTIDAVLTLADAPAEPVEDIRGDVGQPDPEPCPLDATPTVRTYSPCRHVVGHDSDCEPLLPDAAGLRKAGALWALDQAFNRGDVSLWQLREDIVAGRVAP